MSTMRNELTVHRSVEEVGVRGMGEVGGREGSQAGRKRGGKERRGGGKADRKEIGRERGSVEGKRNTGYQLLVHPFCEAFPLVKTLK